MPFVVFYHFLTWIKNLSDSIIDRPSFHKSYKYKSEAKKIYKSVNGVFLGSFSGQELGDDPYKQSDHNISQIIAFLFLQKTG